MSRLVSQSLSLPRRCKASFVQPKPASRGYARKAPIARPPTKTPAAEPPTPYIDDLQKLGGFLDRETAAELQGGDEVLSLQRLALRNPTEVAQRLQSLEGLSNTEMVRKLREYHEKDVTDAKLANSSLPKFAGSHNSYPNLMTPDPIFDKHESVDFPPNKDTPYGGRVIIRNQDSLIQYEHDREAILRGDTKHFERYEGLEEAPKAVESAEDDPLSNIVVGNVHLDKDYQRKLYRFPLINRRVVQQTGKGKIQRQYVLMVVGNGNGLVGFGEGKDEEILRATDKAFVEAVRNMDYVDRFENRTLWTDMETKLGATRVILRPRPVGFGLATNPWVHQVLKAAGIKDASAKVWGSRNPINVIKATFRLIQAGNAPLAMGDGYKGGFRKLDKGVGMRGKDSLERERGRKLVDLRL